MFKVNSVHVLFLIVTLVSRFVTSAPNQNNESSDVTQAKEKAEPDDLNPINDNSEDETQRQKRWFNYYGLGYPPVSPVIYSNNAAGAFNAGAGVVQEDPFVQIYKRIRDITGYSQPSLPPSIPQIPLLFPVIFIPSPGCGCNPNQSPNENKNPTPTLATPAVENNGTTPDLFPRFPEMEDTNQNWGIVIDQSRRPPNSDNSRPISFEPVPPRRPTIRPPPAVDHGSEQAGAPDRQGSTGDVSTTRRPANVARPGQVASGNDLRPSPSNAFRPSTTPLPATSSTAASPVAEPTICERAVLTCCHQQPVTYNCFVAQGCPDPTSFGVPCDARVILRVINNLQRYYEQLT